MQTEAQHPGGKKAGLEGAYGLRGDVCGTDDGARSRDGALRPRERAASRPHSQSPRTTSAWTRGRSNSARSRASSPRRSSRTASAPGATASTCTRRRGGDNYIDVSSLPFQIPLGALIPERDREPAPRVQEHRHHAHHQRLLPLTPGRVERGRSGGRTGGVLYREEASPASGPQGREVAGRLPGAVDEGRKRPELARRHRQNTSISTKC